MGMLNETMVDINGAAKIIGCCKGRILREYVAKGMIPYPDATGRWPISVIQGLVARFDAERQTRKR